jgi:hypothetical protein
MRSLRTCTDETNENQEPREAVVIHMLLNSHHTNMYEQYNETTKDQVKEWWNIEDKDNNGEDVDQAVNFGWTHDVSKVETKRQVLPQQIHAKCEQDRTELPKSSRRIRGSGRQNNHQEHPTQRKEHEEATQRRNDRSSNSSMKTEVIVLPMHEQQSSWLLQQRWMNTEEGKRVTSPTSDDNECENQRWELE